MDELVEQAGLADSRLAEHEHGLRRAGGRDLVEQREELVELLTAADERPAALEAAGASVARTEISRYAATGAALPFSVSGSTASTSTESATSL